jgi:hypothetical protein
MELLLVLEFCFVENYKGAAEGVLGENQGSPDKHVANNIRLFIEPAGNRADSNNRIVAERD